MTDLGRVMRLLYGGLLQHRPYTASRFVCQIPFHLRLWQMGVYGILVLTHLNIQLPDFGLLL